MKRYIVTHPFIIAKGERNYPYYWILIKDNVKYRKSYETQETDNHQIKVRCAAEGRKVSTQEAYRYCVQYYNL